MSIQAERYTGADGMTYRVWRADKDDKTPIHAVYPDGYNPDCSHCWLGATHSEAAHKQQTARHWRR